MMLFKKKDSLSDKIEGAKSVVQESAVKQAGRLNGPVKKVDAASATVLVLGVVNWVSVSLFNFDLVQAIAGRKSIPGRVAYGLLGASALYAAGRGPKLGGK